MTAPPCRYRTEPWHRSICHASRDELCRDLVAWRRLSREWVAVTVLAAIARDALAERLEPDTYALSVSDAPDFESFERFRRMLGRCRPTRSLWRATPWQHSRRVIEADDLLGTVVQGAWYTVTNFVNEVAVFEAVVLRDASPHLSVELALLRHGVSAAKAWQAAGAATGTRVALSREHPRRGRTWPSRAATAVGPARPSWRSRRRAQGHAGR